MNSRLVGGSGPYTARLLFVGEAPGREEELRGEPFVGATGQRVRRLIHASGLNDDKDVRFNNAIGYNFGTLPNTAEGLKRLVDAHRGHLEPDLARCTAPVVVACGRASLYRLTGKLGINMETGGCIAARLGGIQRVIVPCVHPASIMRQKIEAGWLLVERAIRLACQLVTGEVTYPNPEMGFRVSYSSAGDIEAALRGATHVALDTEFNADNVPFLIGLTVDGKTIHSCKPTPEVCAVLARHMLRRDLTKILHHSPADITSLRTLGIDVAFPVWDTLLGFALLYPDLDVGLSHVARFYLDGISHWKGMEHNDPTYNALDVAYTWRVWQHEREEMLQYPEMLATFENEVMPLSAMLMAMEDRGMYVDPRRQEEEEHANLIQQAVLGERIAAQVAGVYERRSGPVRAQAAAQVTQWLLMYLPCEAHPKYQPSKKPRALKAFDGKPCPKCEELYVSCEAERIRVKAAKVEANKLSTKAKRWEQRGFDPGNHHDVKWILYDKDGLGLPKQYKGRGKDRTLSSDVDAISKLLASPKTERPEFIRPLLLNIREYQHLQKVMSTFLKPKVDRWGLAHPEYRLWGTGTGRIAGGSDDGATGDKARSEYSFSVMNIDKGVRCIYAPRPRLIWGEATRGNDEAYNNLGEADGGDGSTGD